MPGYQTSKHLWMMYSYEALMGPLVARVAVDVHLIGWVEVEIPKIVRVGVQHGDQRYQSIAKVANVVVKIS